MKALNDETQLPAGIHTETKQGPAFNRGQCSINHHPPTTTAPHPHSCEQTVGDTKETADFNNPRRKKKKSLTWTRCLGSLRCQGRRHDIHQPASQLNLTVQISSTYLLEGGQQPVTAFVAEKNEMNNLLELTWPKSSKES